MPVTVPDFQSGDARLGRKAAGRRGPARHGCGVLSLTCRRELARSATGNHASAGPALIQITVRPRPCRAGCRSRAWRQVQRAPRHPRAGQCRCVHERIDLKGCAAGTRVSYSNTRTSFVTMSKKIGLRGSTDPRGPHIHDFRHRAAAQVMLRCYSSGDDPERRLAALSKSASMYICVVSIDSCPSQRAMPACSTPAWSKSIALVCLRQWNEILFFWIEGHLFAATDRCLCMRCCTASALS